MQPASQRTELSRAAANDPRIERAPYHREPEWFEPHVRSSGDRAVGVVLAICGAAIIAILLSERYGIDLLAGVL